MEFNKFFLIDAVLILLGIALVWIFKPINGKAFDSKTLTSTEAFNQVSENLPIQKDLIELEKSARKNGSGITYNSLIGLWEFVSVWKQETDEKDLISSALLRMFSATLEIKPGESNQFAINNSIKFGLLSIQFVGAGNLKGKQPLLPFFFNCIELKAGESILFSRYLKSPEKNKMPFFALISMEKNGRWLSARGRGGGLALWIKG